MQNITRLALGLGAAAVVASGGSAFTASNVVGGQNVAAYGTSTVSNATTSVIKHNLSADGQNIVSTNLTFSSDLLASHVVQAGFGTTATNAVLQTCSTTPDYVANTITCTYSGSGYATTSAHTFAVAVN